MGEVHMTIPTGVVVGAARIVTRDQRRDYSAAMEGSHGMDAIRELLTSARDAGLLTGNFRGLLHIAIGRTITRLDGTVVSSGLTWRALATELRALRFDTELVRDYGADPVQLATRDRERFWYSAIAAAKVDSAEAVAEADKLAPKLKSLGFVVGPSPVAPAVTKPKLTDPEKDAAKKEDKTAKKKKK